MIETSIGTLKLFPIKENGHFVFYNDAIRINGKVAKGDRISIYTTGYEVVDNKHTPKEASALKATLMVRNEKIDVVNENSKTIEDFYDHVTELYKNRYYFNK